MFSLTHTIKANARNLPNNRSTICAGRQKTWSETKDSIASLAGAFQNHGVTADDRIAILSMNSDRYFEALFASWWAGAVAVPLNIRLSLAEHVGILNDAGAKVLVIDDAFLPMLDALRDQVTSLEMVVFVGEGEAPANSHSYNTLIESNEPVEDAKRNGKDLAGLYYTGGTTGTPKGVMLSQEALMFNNLACAAGGDYSNADIYLHAAPMFHTADSANSGACNLSGVAHVFMPVFDAARLIAMIDEHKVTVTVLVPTMIAMVLDHPDFNVDKLKSLRRLIYGASPMPQALLIRLIDLFPKLQIVQGYGMTEMGPLISILPAECHTLDEHNKQRLLSAGRPGVGVDVKICDDNGAELKPGEVGEIVISSPGHMTGYWNKPKETDDVLRDNWVHSGDCGYLDQDGFIFIVDRKKDMIVTGAENVYSSEVENVISMHPKVSAVAVIGIPSTQWGETVHAIVIPKANESISEDEIISYVKEKIANYKVPRSVSFTNEPFPLSGAGKVLKRALREPFWKDQQRAV